MNTLLSGIRVLDFGRYIAGPFCATLLADLGAEVIRIEKPAGGEDRYTVPVTSEGEGAYYMQIGRNKQSMTLNPMSEEGQEIVKRLVKTADVVVVNVPPKALKKMGLDYESLCAINPSIILTLNTAFGSTGPYAERGGFDTIAQAMSGNMHLSGTQGNPAKSFTPYCDFGTASLSAFGTLAAIMHRIQTGEGQVVEGSLLSTALTFNNAALIEEALLQKNRQGTGTRGQYNAPTDTFETQDGWLSIQVVGQGLFKRWCNLLELNQWLEDPNTMQDSYTRWGVRVALADYDDKWQVALIANNITDERVMTLSNSLPFATTLTGGTGVAYYGIYDRPRSVALELTYNF